MSKINLKEHAGTAYFYTSTSYILANLKNSDVTEIDVTGCKFTTDCIPSLSELQRKGVRFTDTEDLDREFIFRYNEKSLSNEKWIDDQSTSLPFLKRGFNLTEYLAELSEDSVYTYNYYFNMDGVDCDSLNISLFILISMLRPEIKLRPRTYLPDIFKRIGQYFTKNEIDKLIQNQEPLQYLYLNNAPLQVTLTPQMKHISPIGEEEQTVLQFRAKHCLIPACFGTTYCEGPAWDKVFTDCISEVERFQSLYTRTMAALISK